MKDRRTRLAALIYGTLPNASHTPWADAQRLRACEKQVAQAFATADTLLTGDPIVAAYNELAAASEAYRSAVRNYYADCRPRHGTVKVPPHDSPAAEEMREANTRLDVAMAVWASFKAND